MNLTKLNLTAAANAGSVMQVLHPVDRTPLRAADNSPVTITLLGRDSDTFVAAERAARNRQIENLTKKVKFSAAEQDHQAAETLAACTTAWNGIPQGWIDGSDDETPAPLTAANAQALYENTGVAWLREQVDEHVGARANLLKGSPKP